MREAIYLVVFNEQKKLLALSLEPADYHFLKFCI